MILKLNVLFVWIGILFGIFVVGMLMVFFVFYFMVNFFVFINSIFVCMLLLKLNLNFFNVDRNGMIFDLIL